MNKFFKSIAIVILCSVAILATSAEAQQDKFAIKEGNYTANFVDEQTGSNTGYGAAQIVIEKDGTGMYRQEKVSKPCYKGNLKLSQKRDASDQLIFEVKPNSNDCPTAYYLVKKTSDSFMTHNAVVNPQGVYVRVNVMAGYWKKD